MKRPFRGRQGALHMGRRNAGKGRTQGFRKTIRKDENTISSKSTPPRIETSRKNQ